MESLTTCTQVHVNATYVFLACSLAMFGGSLGNFELRNWVRPRDFLLSCRPPGLRSSPAGAITPHRGLGLP